MFRYVEGIDTKIFSINVLGSKFGSPRSFKVMPTCRYTSNLLPACRCQCVGEGSCS